MSTVKASYRELRAEYLNHKHRGTQMPPERLDALVGLAGDLLDVIRFSKQEEVLMDDGSVFVSDDAALDVRFVVQQHDLPHFALC